MALRESGKHFKLDVSKEVMPYNTYTYENVGMGAASIQSALDILNDPDKQQFLNDVGQCNCGIENRMFDLIEYSSTHFKWTAKFLWMDVVFFGVVC